MALGLVLKFKHSFHQKIHNILKSLNPSVFKEAGAYFGGGTLLTLRFNEYRWSKDIDFVCPSGAGYKLLRENINANNFDALFKNTTNIEFPREILTDQYGIRFPVKIENQIIKFEIFRESRIQLDAPEELEWCSLPCLNIPDSFTEKLLANADRWKDKSIESRDLIDLCVLRMHHDIPTSAIEKANAAYDVVKPIQGAIQYFQKDMGYRERCLKSLQIKNSKEIIDGLDKLANDFGSEITKRSSNEAGPEDHVYLPQEINKN